jgi:hypothetical protein
MKKMLFSLFMSCVAHFGIAQRISEPYDFSPFVKDGALKGIPYTEKTKMLQIPEALLKDLTTDALLRTCIKYPLFHVITAFSNIQEGYGVVSGNFNGFSELYQRPNLGSVIFDQYQAQTLSPIPAIETQADKGKLIAEIGFYELIISQPQVMKKLSNEELSQLMIASYNKFTEKSNSHLSSFSRQFSLLVMGNILKEKNLILIEGEKGRDFNAFLASAVLKKDETAKYILDLAASQSKLQK